MEATRADRLLRWNHGETPGPWRVTVFPTNKCNLECKHCWLQAANGADKVVETPDDRLLHFVDECAELGVRDWVIIGGGEPMLRGSLVIQMIKKIRAHGMNGTLQCNGTVFKREHFEAIIESGWANVNISLDGPTEEINDDIRSAGFKKATSNIRLLTQMKKERGSKTPVVSLYTVMHRHNWDKLLDQIELARDLGCDGGVHLTTMVVHSAVGEPYTLLPDQAAALPDEIRKAMELTDKYGMPNNFEPYLRNDILVNSNAMQLVDSPVYDYGMGHSLCYEPFLGLVVTAQGVVGPCCAFWDETAPNINDHSFKDIWDGEYFKELRHQHLVTHKVPGYCKKCPSNLFCLNEKIRHDVHRLEEAELWDSLNAVGRVSFLANKAAASLKKHGIKSAVKRGLEWSRIG